MTNEEILEAIGNLTVLELSELLLLLAALLLRSPSSM